MVSPEDRHSDQYDPSGSGTSGCCPVRGRARCWVLRDRRPGVLGTGLLGGGFLGLLPLTSFRGWVGEYRPYVENSIVDASIFDSDAFVCRGRVNVPSILLAGCVGPLVKPAAVRKCSCGCDSYSCMWSSFQEQMVDALASGAEEGRSNLR